MYWIPSGLSEGISSLFEKKVASWFMLAVEVKIEQ